MALANYDDLKESLSSWMARSDIDSYAADCIALAEASLNRELSPVEVDASLIGVLGSRSIDVSSLAIVEPIALFLQDVIGNEQEIGAQPPGSQPGISFAGAPMTWALDGSSIRFERALNAPYPFRLRYRQRFKLSDEAPTNWLLTNHPDVYLAACIVWGGMFLQDADMAAGYATMLQAKLPEVKRIIAQSRRGSLRVDPLLSGLGRGVAYHGWG